MDAREMVTLLRPRRPPAPFGVRALARVNSIEELARLARRRLPKAIAGYLDGGGESEYTLRNNRDAFDRWQLVPERMVDVSHIDTTTTLLGTPSQLPIALAPVGAPRLFHPEGELAAARAAARLGIPYGISTLATVSLEHLAVETAAALWFQLYLWGDRGMARDLVARAQEFGYRAMLVSADVTVRSKRERELNGGMELPTPHPSWTAVLDGALHPRWSWRFVTNPAPGFPNIGIDSVADDTMSMSHMFDGTLTWVDLDWLRDSWQGPLAVKGILRADDARRAVDHGADAVIVSNHGGRQADHVPATIDALAAVVDAVADRAEVLVDSGFRRGSDILTALAVGARGVLVGRAYLYGLAAAGEAGVRHAVDILRRELEIEMGLCGVRQVRSSLRPDLVAHVDHE